MNSQRLLALPLLVGLAAMACQSETPVEANWIPDGPTYEEAWIGVYQGTGNAELLETGESFTDVPICLELWVSNGMLHGVVHVQVLPLDALTEDADDRDLRRQYSRCAGPGATMTVREPVEEVNSEDALQLERPAATRQQAEYVGLQIKRLGEDELVGSLSAPGVRISFAMIKKD